jgi:hypothetical protein
MDPAEAFGPRMPGADGSYSSRRDEEERAMGDPRTATAAIAAVGDTLVEVAAGRSILYDQTSQPDASVSEPPAYFSDLNLDQIVASVTADREPYDLTPFFSQHLESVDTIHYRHEVFQDLEHGAVLGDVAAFAAQMRDMREQIIQMEKLRERYQKERYFLDVITTYTGAVKGLARRLCDAELSSRGLRSLRDYLATYTSSPAFTALATEAAQVLEALSKITYTVHVKGNRATVGRYQGEPDYSAEVLQTFERFRQGATKDYRVGFHNSLEMNHVEAMVLELVARLFPDEFALLDGYYQRHLGYLDDVVGRFDREVQFYIAYLDYLAPMRAAGLQICYPEVARASKEIFANDTYDLALAAKLVATSTPVVCNDFYLRGQERILVVSGPNQGGKTTVARTFGQLHHLASIGCPVPGSTARLYLFDQLFAHFGREEDLAHSAGKLEDDLLRVRDILVEATSDSVVILNEIFSSTTLHDALFLGTKVMEQVIELDLLCVCVTFIDELASLGPSTVSMMSTVNPDSPADRTYKVVRRRADGLAYALAIAEKYGVSYNRLKGRIGS